MNYPVRVAMWNGKCGVSHQIVYFYYCQTKPNKQINKQKKKRVITVKIIILIS